MSNDQPTGVKLDAPAQYRTPQRPGQSGEAGQKLNGPSPLSKNATGPHPPYEPDDPEGLAAGKHSGAGGPADAPKTRETGLMGPNFSIIGGN